MSTIQWATGTSGTWTTGSDWTGGVAPGVNDTAVISAASNSAYTVTLNSGVTVAGVTLDQTHATLALSGYLTASDIELQAGTLALDMGTLTGTVTETGAKLDIGSGPSVLSGVTWHGALTPVYVKEKGKNPQGTLTISNGFTLTNAAGTGPGTANFTGALNLSAMSVLDNASITAGSISVTSSPNLTFGSGLNLTGLTSAGAFGGALTLTKQETLTNDGTLTGFAINRQLGQGSTLGTFVNAGVLNVGNAKGTETGLFQVNSFTNDGAISVGAGSSLVLNPLTLQAAGTGASIALGGLLVLNGTLTTAQMFSLRAAQNVTTTGSAYGFGFTGTLSNQGSTLTVGTGTALGVFAGGSITGGTVMLANGSTINGGGGTFTNVSLQTTGAELTTNGLSMANVTLNGPSILDVFGNNVALTGSALNGVGTLLVDSTLTLNNDTIPGVNGSGQVVVAVSAGDGLSLGASQSIAGYTIGLTDAALSLTAGTTLDGATINVTNATGNSYASSILGGGVTFGPAMAINVAAGAGVLFNYAGASTPLVFDGTITSAGSVNIGQFTGTEYFNNAGNIQVSAGGTFWADGANAHVTNSGTIAVTGGVLAISPSQLVNTGSISVTDGTLVLQGALTVPSLSAISDPGSALVVGGPLDLGGGTYTPGADNLAMFSLSNGQVNDGTLVITAGETLSGVGNNAIGATLVDSGSLAFSGANATDTVSTNISGGGAVSISGAGGTLLLGGTVSAGSTIAFLGPNEVVGFTNQAAETSFGGTISGFAVQDKLEFAFADLKGASFVGSSIVATLTNGHTFAFATDTALHGVLTVAYQGHVGTITFASANASVNDWSAADTGAAHAGGFTAPAQELGHFNPFMVESGVDLLPLHSGF
jgi:fibronectin-binding autotransporter adhesin